MEEHEVSQTEAMEEEMFLGLRKTEGVSLQLFNSKFGKSLKEVYGEVLEELSEKGLIFESEGSIKLTGKGVFRGNEVFQQFLK